MTDRARRGHVPCGIEERKKVRRHKRRKPVVAGAIRCMTVAGQLTRFREPSKAVGCMRGMGPTSPSPCDSNIPKFDGNNTYCCSDKGGGVGTRLGIYFLPLAAPIGLSPLLILTLCGPERVLVVSTEPLNDLSCLTTPGSAVVPETGCCPCR